MNTFRIVMTAMLTVACALASHRSAPLPSALVSAKTVYLQNMGQDAATFDHIYDSVSKWGRWQVVADRKDADVVLLFTDSNQIGYVATSSTVGGYSSSSIMPLISMPRYVVIVDRETGDQLINVSCERRLTGGGTAGQLVNKLRKRMGGS